MFNKCFSAKLIPGKYLLSNLKIKLNKTPKIIATETEPTIVYNDKIFERK